MKIKANWSYLLVVGFLTAVLSIAFFVFHLPDFWPQVLAIISSAFLGAGATAWLTNTLLKNQQEGEEAKEKNIRIYEKKLEVYSKFNAGFRKKIQRICP